MPSGGSRRAWILGLLSLLLGSTVAQSLATAQRAPVGMAQVAIVRSEGQVESAVREAVALAGGLGGVISPGAVVVVKPNLVMDAGAASGMVTDPAVTRAVVRLARGAGAGEVIIAEGSAQYGTGDPNRDRFCTRTAFRSAGYDSDGDMREDVTGAPLVDLNDSGGTGVADPARVTRVVVPAGLMRTEYWVPNVVLEADVLISVPVLKNHYNAGVTLGMKNLIGLLPNDLYHGPGNIYGKNSLSHSPVELDRHIVDVNLARRPDFVVVDGQRGMIDGPVGSQIIAPPMGLIIAGRDVVAVDTVGTLVMGYDPTAIPYLGLGAQSGLGTTDTGRIHVAGVPVAEARRDFPVPYAGSIARRADAEPPQGSIVVTPEGGFPGPVTVLVEAHDNDGMARVELYLDGVRVAQAFSPPYHFDLDLEPGRHVLHAVLYDRALNRTDLRHEMTVADPTTASPVPEPTETISPPTPSLRPTAVPTETPTEVPTVDPTPAATGTPTVIPSAPSPTAAAVESAPATVVASPEPATSELAWTPEMGLRPSLDLVPEAAAATPSRPPVGGSWTVGALVWHALAIVALATAGIAVLVTSLLVWRRGRD